MSYVALYRKARPSVFDDVRGQDHIVTTLKNQVMAGRIQRNRQDVHRKNYGEGRELRKPGKRESL